MKLPKGISDESIKGIIDTIPEIDVEQFTSFEDLSFPNKKIVLEKLIELNEARYTPKEQRSLKAMLRLHPVEAEIWKELREGEKKLIEIEIESESDILLIQKQKNLESKGEKHFIEGYRKYLTIMADKLQKVNKGVGGESFELNNKLRVVFLSGQNQRELYVGSKRQKGFTEKEIEERWKHIYSSIINIGKEVAYVKKAKDNENIVFTDPTWWLEDQAHELSHLIVFSDPAIRKIFNMRENTAGVEGFAIADARIGTGVFARPDQKELKKFLVEIESEKLPDISQINDDIGENEGYNNNSFKTLEELDGRRNPTFSMGYFGSFLWAFGLAVKVNDQALDKREGIEGTVQERYINGRNIIYNLAREMGGGLQGPEEIITETNVRKYREKVREKRRNNPTEIGSFGQVLKERYGIDYFEEMKKKDIMVEGQGYLRQFLQEVDEGKIIFDLYE